MLATTILLSKFLEQKEGEITGKCILCSRETTRGVEIKQVISDHFTAYELFQAGNCFCPACASCFSPEIRRNNWLVTEKEFKTFKRPEMLSILQDLPIEPFMLSLTQTYKKYGFLFVANTINYSREKFLVAFEDRSLKINYQLFQESLTMINQLRELKITKAELATGEFYPSAITKILEAGYYDQIQSIKEKCKNANWILALFVAK